MPERKPNAKSWIATAFSAAGRFGRQMREEWKAGEAEAGQPLPEADPDPRTPRAPGPAATPPWCEVLQLDPAASKEDIQQAYRRLIKEIHPDKVAHLSPELQSLVKREAQRLNDAYEQAMNQE
jgi:DnaJ-domain-containing protein 1